MDVHLGRNEAELGKNTNKHFTFYPEADFSLCLFLMPAHDGGMCVLL